MRRALVMRAREDAARTAERLRDMGFEPVLSPVLEIVATGAAIPPGDYDAVLASSAKGVEHADHSADAFKRLPFHTVGAKTARAAEMRGWRPDIVAADAEAILPLLASRYTARAHFLYLAGRDRQPALETGLRAAGCQVTPVETYEARTATALTHETSRAIDAGEIDVALHYSRRSAEIFLALAQAAGLTGKLATIAHVALSDDVAGSLRAAGLGASVASQPDEAHLLALLRA